MELVREFDKKEIFTEKTIEINYFGEDEMDIKPITRISSSLEGHKDAVLDV